MNKEGRLKKQLSLPYVYAVSTGATLSAGFFLLPGIAAQQAGPALILAYLVAAIPLVPATFSMLELATAMPRAGGLYYFLDRSLGPLAGTIGGIGTWLALGLKIAFALVGMGAYVRLFVDTSMTTLALALAGALGLLNLFGAKKSGSLQLVLVAIVLGVLGLFIGTGLFAVEAVNYAGFFDSGVGAIFSTAGLVYISYVGVTKVASLAEEIDNPERNLPLATFLSLATAVLVYGLGTTVMVGVVPQEQLKGDLTCVATAAKAIAGPAGLVIITVCALCAFMSVANAGLLSASRYPLAMGRDHLMPSGLRKLSRSGVPVRAVLVTLTLIVLIIVFLDPARIAKLASAFQLLLFGFACFAVIVMRESRIDSYDPGFRSPLYPWMQVFGIVGSLALIIEMGAGPSLFSLALIVISVTVYLTYGRKRTSRRGAILHVFERLGRERFEGLDTEFRGIMKEKGLRTDDPFEDVIARGAVLDLGEAASFEEVVRAASAVLGSRLGEPADALSRRFLEGTRVGATPVEFGIAIPHMRLRTIEKPELVVVRASAGVDVGPDPAAAAPGMREQVFALFFLVSPEANASQHLRLLARIAARAEESDFMTGWELARDAGELKRVLLKSDRTVQIELDAKTGFGDWIGLSVEELELPAGCEVASILRRGEPIEPADAVLETGDVVSVTGRARRLAALRARDEAPSD